MPTKTRDLFIASAIDVRRDGATVRIPAGAGSSSTFEPRGSTGEGQGSVIVQLYSMNPYGAEIIQEVKYELERADILRRGPIKIAPTHQLRAG